jgi:DNA-binding GntR family transcriptional regulator
MSELTAKPSRKGSRLTGLGKTERHTLQDQIYAKLCDAIMAGKLRPGRVGSIRGLAASLGTSAIPVREALSRLAAERAIEILPTGAVAIPTMSRARFIDLRRTRLIVEGPAIELAAAKIDDSTLDRVETLYRQMVEAQTKQNAKRFLALNQRLRFIIYEAAGSPTLMPIISSLWLQVGPFFTLSFVDSALDEVLKFDLKAIRAMRRRNAKEARHWIERDIMETGDFILTVLDGEDLAKDTQIVSRTS